LANKPAKMRMCISCRAARPQNEMHRLVRTPEGEARIDNVGSADGRGAYLCKNRACIEKAQLQRRAERALSCRVPTEIYEQLGEMYA